MLRKFVGVAVMVGVLLVSATPVHATVIGTRVATLTTTGSPARVGGDVDLGWVQYKGWRGHAHIKAGGLPPGKYEYIVRQEKVKVALGYKTTTIKVCSFAVGPAQRATSCGGTADGVYRWGQTNRAMIVRVSDGTVHIDSTTLVLSGKLVPYEVSIQ